MASSNKVVKETNVVHQNEILVETIKKEMRTLKLHTDYLVNPYKKVYSLTPKPNAPEMKDVEADYSFIEQVHKASQGPKEKFSVAQTEAQEIGWYNDPLIAPARGDRRLHHPKVNTALTRFMEAYWLEKEQAKMGSKS